jgi:hypothetical protein
MTKNCLEDLTTCLHYSDDWECDGNWDDIYPGPKVEAEPGTARFRLKHGRLEDAYNKICTVLLLLLLLFESILTFLPSFFPYLKRWPAIVNPGRWITTDESRVAGWYHSVMTIGPDPKPIRTGATLHTACITKGPLATYKLFARVYGGEGDDDINRRNEHTATHLKTVSLFDFMLESFKGKGHSVVMDSAYMSDAMCLVG